MLLCAAAHIGFFCLCCQVAIVGLSHCVYRLLLYCCWQHQQQALNINLQHHLCRSIVSTCRCLIPCTGSAVDFADEAQVAIFDATNSTEERREKLVSPQQQSKAALYIRCCVLLGLCFSCEHKHHSKIVHLGLANHNAKQLVPMMLLVPCINTLCNLVSRLFTLYQEPCIIVSCHVTASVNGCLQLGQHDLAER